MVFYIALDQLPDDIDLPKSLVAEQHARNKQLQADNQAVIQENEGLKARVLTLQEQLNLALAASSRPCTCNSIAS
jgi:hypothetical protein